LKRHGARFPTKGASEQILSALDKLQSATSYTHPDLKFLQDFTYDLGTEALVPLGASQSVFLMAIGTRDSTFSRSHIGGQSAFIRYHDLVENNNIPFVRASGSERVIDSATNWTAGWCHSEFEVILLLTMLQVFPSPVNIGLTPCFQ